MLQSPKRNSHGTWMRRCDRQWTLAALGRRNLRLTKINFQVNKSPAQDVQPFVSQESGGRKGETKHQQKYSL